MQFSGRQIEAAELTSSHGVRLLTCGLISWRRDRWLDERARWQAAEGTVFRLLFCDLISSSEDEPTSAEAARVFASYAKRLAGSSPFRPVMDAAAVGLPWRGSLLFRIDCDERGRRIGLRAGQISICS